MNFQGGSCCWAPLACNGFGGEVLLFQREALSHLKNISQIGSFPQVGVKIKKS